MLFNSIVCFLYELNGGRPSIIELHFMHLNGISDATINIHFVSIIMTNGTIYECIIDPKVHT